ncbi:OLC1v1019711C1 [Oldenlandia corymbosa var. corymbosa]|uniref:Dirigent protein n=1 Tax=Oldenlandia corymbosa var. corymbosa TaxID=529605 RepID=A0AAV1EEU9_OLDCO|nr:OLC1v1019711C1 [Oldenlandia corymbosa var. corymbosa]
MATKWAQFVILAILLSIAPLGQAIPSQTEEAVDKWFKNLPHAKPKYEKLHFFIHELVTGPNITIVPVAKSNFTDKLSSRFGLVYVIDEPLKVGASPDSETIGRVEGLDVSSSKEKLTMLAAFNFVVTKGQHKGSTLSVLGRLADYSDNHEFPILGGSGDFRLAQGFIVFKVYSVDPATGNVIVECRAQFLHY